MFPAGDPSPGDLLGSQPAPGRRLLWQWPGGLGDAEQQEFIRAAAGSPAAARGRLRADDTGGQCGGRGACGEWSEPNTDTHKSYSKHSIHVIEPRQNCGQEGPRIIYSHTFSLKALYNLYCERLTCVFIMHTLSITHTHTHTYTGSLKPWLVVKGSTGGFSLLTWWECVLQNKAIVLRVYACVLRIFEKVMHDCTMCQRPWCRSAAQVFPFTDKSVF